MPGFGWRLRCCSPSYFARLQRLLVTFGLWLLLTFLWPSVLAQMLAAIIAPGSRLYRAWPSHAGNDGVGADTSRLSPSTLFGEIALCCSIRMMSARSGSDLSRPVAGCCAGSVAARQSLTHRLAGHGGIGSGTIVLFTIGYMVFQRQEVRA
jgi:ABC-2 type transport system permease protein